MLQVQARKLDLKLSRKTKASDAGPEAAPSEGAKAETLRSGLERSPKSGKIGHVCTYIRDMAQNHNNANYANAGLSENTKTKTRSILDCDVASIRAHLGAE